MTDSALGGSVGGTCDGTSEAVGSDPDSHRTTHVLIDGVLFHDITRTCNAASHMECLFVQGASYVTIRNSQLRNCDGMDMSFHSINSATPPDNVLIENNWFDHLGGTSIIPLGHGPGGDELHPPLQLLPLSVLRRRDGHMDELQRSREHQPDEPVGVRCRPQLLAQRLGQHDLRRHRRAGGARLRERRSLRPSSCHRLGRRQRRRSAQYPGKDIDGQSRPMGSAPDAVADEEG